MFKWIQSFKKIKEQIETTMPVISSAPPPGNNVVNAQYGIPDYSLYLALKYRDDNAAVNIFNHCKENKQPYLFGRMVAIVSKLDLLDITKMPIKTFDCCPNINRLIRDEEYYYFDQLSGRFFTPNPIFMGVKWGYDDYYNVRNRVTKDDVVAALNEADGLPRTVADDGSRIITLDPTAGPGGKPLVVVVQRAGAAGAPAAGAPAAGAPAAGALGNVEEGARGVFGVRTGAPAADVWSGAAAGIGPRRRTRRNRSLKRTRRNRRSSRN